MQHFGGWQRDLLKGGSVPAMRELSLRALRDFPYRNKSLEAEPVAPVDRAWLRMDEPENLMQVTGVLVLDRFLPLQEAQAVLRERLIGVPRFCDRVERDERGFFWVRTESMDLENQVVEEELPPPGGPKELAEAVGRWMSAPLSRVRPLWEIRLLQGFEGSKTVLLCRLHHAIGDGVALMVVLLALTDPPEAENGERGDAAADHEQKTSTGSSTENPFLALLRERSQELLALASQQVARWMPETYRLMTAPVEAYARLSAGVRQLAAAGSLSRLALRSADPPSPFKGSLGIDKRVAWTEPVALEELRSRTRSLDVSLNELLNTAMVGAMRRYLIAQRSVSAGFAVRCAMPVNLRPLEEMSALGNRFGLIFLPLPLGIEEPMRRLYQLRKEARALRHSAEPLVVLGLLDLAGRLPEAGQQLLVKLFGAKATAVFTNVPGPRAPLTFAKRRISEIFFWVPQAGRLGLGVSIFSYAGKVRMGVATDAGLVPDPERLVEGFHRELESLL